MITFLERAHMLNATQMVWVGGDDTVPCTCTHVGCYARCWVGVGGMTTFLVLAHMLNATQLVWGWGRGENVPCACTHVRMLRKMLGWGGGMITFLALALARKKCGAFLMSSCPSP